MHPSHLADNPWIVGLVLFYGLTNLYAWRADGAMPLQSLWFRRVLSTRVFESRPSSYNLMLVLLLSQYVVSTALVLFYALEPQAADRLASPDAPTWLSLAVYGLTAAAWFAVQWGMFNWMGYIFGVGERLLLLNRIYVAIHLYAGQAITVLLAYVVVAEPKGEVAAILLFALFILAQTMFVYRAFKIFLVNISTLYLLIAYLCALEIAPIAVIYAKITG